MVLVVYLVRPWDFSSGIVAVWFCVQNEFLGGLPKLRGSVRKNVVQLYRSTRQKITNDSEIPVEFMSFTSKTNFLGSKNLGRILKTSSFFLPFSCRFSSPTLNYPKRRRIFASPHFFGYDCIVSQRDPRKSQLTLGENRLVARAV